MLINKFQSNLLIPATIILMVLSVLYSKFAVSIAVIVAWLFPISYIVLIFLPMYGARFGRAAIVAKLIVILLFIVSVYYLNVSFDNMPAFNEYNRLEASLAATPIILSVFVGLFGLSSKPKSQIKL